MKSSSAVGFPSYSEASERSTPTLGVWPKSTAQGKKMKPEGAPPPPGAEGAGAGGGDGLGSTVGGTRWGLGVGRGWDVPEGPELGSRGGVGVISRAVWAQV